MIHIALLFLITGCSSTNSCPDLNPSNQGQTDLASSSIDALTDASLADASFADASLVDASLVDASFADASLVDASLVDASLADAFPGDAFLDCANLNDNDPCGPSYCVDADDWGSYLCNLKQICVFIVLRCSTWGLVCAGGRCK